MSTEDRDYDSFSIVPERDELVSHRKHKRGTSMTSGSAGGPGKGPAPKGLSGAVKFLLGLLFVGMCATGGGAYYFYERSTETLAMLDRSNNRIEDLEDRLGILDASSEQSSSRILEQVNSNFEQIDLLWRNIFNHNDQFDEVEASVAQSQSDIEGIETAVANQASMNNQQAASIDRAQQTLETLDNRLSSLNSSVAALNNLNLNQQLASITRDLDNLKSSMATEDSGLADRVNINEQDIESINLYRLSLNQTINTLQQSLNELEERVAAMTTSSAAF